MKILYPNEKYIPEKELVATVGFFDGVHLGHRFLINELIRFSKEQNRISAVITFISHPRKVLHADFQPLLLTTFDEKMEQLSSTGIDLCIVLDFSVEMSKLSAFDFLNNILFKQFNVRTLLVGHDHRFGYNRSDSFPEYKSYGEQIGIQAIQATRFSLPDFTHISSSDIRNALRNSDIDKANKLLGYNYSLTGKVTNGLKIGRKLGFPTANIKPNDTEKQVPATGVYAVNVFVENSFFNGMLNIGNRPTIDNDKHISIEVNIFNFNKDIYNQEIKVIFVAKIRDEQKFNSLDELIFQLNQDKISTSKILDLQQ
jgi:riboflavin kinase/FMN adenylyltransferase